MQDDLVVEKKNKWEGVEWCIDDTYQTHILIEDMHTNKNVCEVEVDFEFDAEDHYIKATTPEQLATAQLISKAPLLYCMVDKLKEELQEAINEVNMYRSQMTRRRSDKKPVWWNNTTVFNAEMLLAECEILEDKQCLS